MIQFIERSDFTGLIAILAVWYIYINENNTRLLEQSKYILNILVFSTCYDILWIVFHANVSVLNLIIIY